MAPLIAAIPPIAMVMALSTLRAIAEDTWIAPGPVARVVRRGERELKW